jgi:hypothetical protein
MRGGIIDVHYCSKPDDPDRLPMGIGDLEGCMSEMYAQSPLRAATKAPRPCSLSRFRKPRSSWTTTRAA